MPGVISHVITFIQPCPVPNGAAGLALLGKICRKSNRKDRAIQYFKMSISLDPFLWTSFETLAELGVDYSPSTAFGVEPTSENIAATAAATPLQPVASTPAPGMGQSFASSVAPSVLRNRSVHFVETPGLTPISSANNSMLPMGGTETPISKALATPQNPVVLRRAKDIAGRHYYPPSPETPLTHMTRSMRYLKGLGSTSSMDDVTGARSLFLATENKASNQASVATASVPPLAVSSTTKAAEDGEKPEKVPAENKVDGILELLAVMGGAYQRICRYQSRAALQLLGSLPPRQQITGWVLHQQGRAFLEMNDFTAAQRSLELMQVKDPGRMQGLELLSTVYWQLKKEVSLANLSQRVVDMDRLSPQAWCVVGNCFSLQKDHESALVFFKRSLQLDNDFTYSHTLSGYEYMANEDFDKAIACFRQALRVDERHYNAWYGLGAIYHRQEKFDVAEHHFEKAVAINSGSSVLRCNLGIAQHANGKSYQALDTLHGAFQLDPKNPQARFQRATIYSALQRPEEALVELEKVRDAAPREATIHFAMGKVLKRLGRLEEAMKCFLTAMDLDPKDNQMIKSAMDKLDEPDADEEAMAAF